MKRLIVLATLATLLGSASGCSMFNRTGAQSCDPTSSEPLLSRIRLPSISLPWSRLRDLDGQSECSTCNGGASEATGFSEPAFGNARTVFPQGTVVDGAIIGSQVIDGVVTDEGFSSPTTISGDQALYHPEVVGPVSSPSYTTRYAGELIPAPGSPAVDLAK